MHSAGCGAAAEAALCRSDTPCQQLQPASPALPPTCRCSTNGAVVGALMLFCTRPMRTMRGGRSCSGAASKRYACGASLAVGWVGRWGGAHAASAAATFSENSAHPANLIQRARVGRTPACTPAGHSRRLLLPRWPRLAAGPPPRACRSSGRRARPEPVPACPPASAPASRGVARQTGQSGAEGTRRALPQLHPAARCSPAAQHGPDLEDVLHAEELLLGAGWHGIAVGLCKRRWWRRWKLAVAVAVAAAAAEARGL